MPAHACLLTRAEAMTESTADITSTRIEEGPCIYYVRGWRRNTWAEARPAPCGCVAPGSPAVFTSHPVSAPLVEPRSQCIGACFLLERALRVKCASAVGAAPAACLHVYCCIASPASPQRIFPAPFRAFLIALSHRGASGMGRRNRGRQGQPCSAASPLL